MSEGIKVAASTILSDQIRHFSRHRTLATMLIYSEEHDREAVQKTLADVVAATLTA